MKTQNVFINSLLQPILDRFEESNDGSLSEQDFKKIKNYYGLGSVVLVGEGIAGLHGCELSNKERKALTCVSAITGLYDDFFDKSTPDLERIKLLSEVDQTVYDVNTHEALFRELLKTALQNISDVKTSKAFADEVYKSQVESLKQKTAGLSWEELLEIALQKGGFSLLLYRSTLSPVISDEEKHVLFLIGSATGL